MCKDLIVNKHITVEANSVESRYSGVLEGWIEDAPDDHHDEHTLELKHHVSYVDIQMTVDQQTDADFN